MIEKNQEKYFLCEMWMLYEIQISTNKVLLEHTGVI